MTLNSEMIKFNLAHSLMLAVLVISMHGPGPGCAKHTPSHRTQHRRPSEFVLLLKELSDDIEHIFGDIKKLTEGIAKRVVSIAEDEVTAGENVIQKIFELTDKFRNRLENIMEDLESRIDDVLKSIFSAENNPITFLLTSI